jgi:hypothetical protein
MRQEIDQALEKLWKLAGQERRQEQPAKQLKKRATADGQVDSLRAAHLSTGSTMTTVTQGNSIDDSTIPSSATVILYSRQRAMRLW